MSVYYLRSRKVRGGCRTCPPLSCFPTCFQRTEEREVDKMGILFGLCLWIPILKTGTWPES